MTNDTEAGSRIVGTLRAEAGKGVVGWRTATRPRSKPVVGCTDLSRLARWVLKWMATCASAASSALASPAAGKVPGAWRSANLHGWALVTLSPGQDDATVIEGPTVRPR